MTLAWIDVDRSIKEATETVGCADIAEVWLASRPDETDVFARLEDPCPIGATVRARRQFVAMPPGARPQIMAELTEAVAAGAPRVIRLYPSGGGHGYPLEDWVLVPIPAVCERDGYSLALDYGAGASAPLGEVARFAHSTPEVPMLLLGRHLDVNLGALSLLDVAPNVLLEVTPTLTALCLESAVDRFGAHRFVFGTHDGPVKTAALPLAGLSADDRVSVAGANARMLDDGEWRNRYL
jgi:hypothetical protein